MLTARADHGVLGYLGRGLSLEFSAVQLYSTQARLVAYWGLSAAAERLRHEAEEELQHTDRIIERMLALGAAPNASQLRPVRLGENLVEMLGINQRFELLEVRRLHVSRRCLRAIAMQTEETTVVAPKHRFQIEYFGIGKENSPDYFHRSSGPSAGYGVPALHRGQ